MMVGDLAEILQEFNEEAGENWKIILNRMLRGKETEKNLQAVFIRLTIYVKHMIVENRTSEIQELQEFLQNEILYKLLMKYEEEKVSLVNCYMEKLELLYLEKQKTKGDILVEEIFENIIVRKNPAFLKKYSFYEMEREDELLNLGNAMDSIVMESVRRRLSVTAMRDYLFYKFPSATVEMNEKIVEQYEKHYKDLRSRYNIELQETESRFDSVEKVVSMVK